MTALIGAGMFGLVPHPMASLEPDYCDQPEALRSWRIEGRRCVAPGKRWHEK
jgi:hypothetical protein